MKTWIPDNRNFAYLTWKQVDALPRSTTLLVLPTAAIEQHGHHLPLATDTLINNLLLGKALALLPAEMSIFALPPVCYGKSNEHIGFPGTLSVGAQTFLAVVRDLGASIAACGFKKVVLYNTHGGNTSLVDVLARDLRAEFGLRTFSLFGSPGAAFDGVSEQERAYGFHAGEIETAYLLHATPGLVHPEEYTTNYIARVDQSELIKPEGSSANFAWLTKDIAPSGVLGDPTAATAEKGERWSNDAAAHIAELLVAMYNFEPEVRRLTITLVDCGNGIRLERGVGCRLGDGTTLISDHYYPAGQGPWPTLLMRQPYGRDIASTVVYAHPVWFARHGYHVVIQDVRGRGGSSGDFYPFRHEGRDGAETIAWLRTLPASNGRIGMYGFSYQGATQLLAAAERPEGLLCIAPHMTATDLYHGWFYHHGALRLNSTLGWGIQMLREDARRRGLRTESDRLESAWTNIHAQAAHVPYSEHPAIADPLLPDYVRDWISHREPGEYWTAQDISTRLDRIQVPALHIAGWFDTYLEGSIAGYIALSQGAGSEFARTNQYLIAGPWAHIPWGERVGDANLGEAANLDTDTLLLHWFNHWLKKAGDFIDEPRIRYFTLGPNEWRSASEWPSDAAHPLYLHSAGHANSRKGDGRLTKDSPKNDEPNDVFVYDPEVPVLAPGGSQAQSGPFDQSVVEMGNNLLVYTSEQMRRETEIFGQPRIRLYAVTSSSHADFTAKLVRVTVAGCAEFLSIGIARSSWLFGDERHAADEVREWEFALEPTAFVLAVGERLRLEIASSAFPLYDRNPSTDTPPQLADTWNWSRSTQQVLHSASCPSTLYLPVKGDPGW